MKARVVTLQILLFAVFTVVSAGAQTTQSANTDAKGINASFTESLGTANLLAEATSIDRNSQTMALDTITQLVSKGKLSQNDTAKALTVLRALAYSGTINETISGMTVINSYPTIRMEACRILGELGGAQAEGILLRVLANDPEPMVLSEATFQLGRLGTNPKNRVSEAISAAFGRQDAFRLDNNFAYASLLAFESIAKKNRGITDPSVFDVIARIQSGDYVTTVKQKAARVMAELRLYN